MCECVCVCKMLQCWKMTYSLTFNSILHTLLVLPSLQAVDGDLKGITFIILNVHELVALISSS